MTFALAVALGAAGIIHCLLAPEHMEISFMFGAGFLAAGIAQLAMAAMAILRPSRLVHVAIIASTLALTGLYAYNVAVGLPFREPAAVAAVIDAHTADTAHEHADAAATAAAQAGVADHHKAGVVVGAGEPVDPYGAMTQLAQLSAAAAALTLLVRRTPGGRALRLQ